MENEAENLIAIILDVDWVLDLVVKDPLDLRKTAVVRATLLATHLTSLPDGIRGHGIGIHPNLLRTKDDRSELDRMTGLVSAGTGVGYHWSEPSKLDT